MHAITFEFWELASKIILIWKVWFPLHQCTIYREYWNLSIAFHVFQKSNQNKPRPKWKDELSAKDRAEGLEKLQKLKDRHSFLRNPRFLPPNAQQGGSSLIHPRTKVAKTEQERKKMEEQRYLYCAEYKGPFYYFTSKYLLFYHISVNVRKAGYWYNGSHMKTFYRL